MLKQGRENLPESMKKSTRFEIPKVKGHVEGTKTIISNFHQIVDILRRPADQILKYLQRELATPAKIEGQRLIFGRKLTSALINAKIEQYAKEFVLCDDCGKPDTQLSKENNVLVKKCMACGAKRPIKSKI